MASWGCRSGRGVGQARRARLVVLDDVRPIEVPVELTQSGEITSTEVIMTLPEVPVRSWRQCPARADVGWTLRPEFEGAGRWNELPPIVVLEWQGRRVPNPSHRSRKAA
jgi:hypothetical protein